MIFIISNHHHLRGDWTRHCSETNGFSPVAEPPLPCRPVTPEENHGNDVVVERSWCDKWIIYRIWVLGTPTCWCSGTSSLPPAVSPISSTRVGGTEWATHTRRDKTLKDAAIYPDLCLCHLTHMWPSAWRWLLWADFPGQDPLGTQTLPRREELRWTPGDCHCANTADMTSYLRSCWQSLFELQTCRL